MAPTPPRSAPAVHQFHSGSASGDAVTNSLLLTRELLLGLGYRSEIYVEHVAPELRAHLRHFREYQPGPDDTLIVHHSMGHDQAQWVLDLRVRKILHYHNITPASFFAPGSRAHHYAGLGRRQLDLLRPACAAASADSAYNAQELHEHGYAPATVLPLLMDVDALRAGEWSREPVEQSAGVYTVLFVGRVAENKGHHHLVEAFRRFHAGADRPVQLVLVGGYDESSPYLARLRAQVRAAGLEPLVRFTGKVSAAELYGWYRAADAFICMSEHEGFGVPLIEAMLFDVPVVACASSSIPDTLGGAGVLLAEHDPAAVAGVLSLLSRDRALRRAVQDTQRERVKAFARPRLVEGLREVLARAGVPAGAPDAAAAPSTPRPSPGWQVEGPFETTYSLAIVNRELARALDAQEPGRVALFPTEGPGDYTPRPEDLARHAELEPLWRRGGKGLRPDVVVRYMYPPRVADADGRLNLLYLGWEESLVPQAWVDTFNLSLDGVAVPSEFVRKALVDSGVEVPVRVVPHGVEHVRREGTERFPGSLGRRFRFLHVSSAFPRKGVDVLLRAYGRAFSAADDVSLVLKCFPNPHNDVEAQLAALRRERPDYPHVVLINRDLPQAQLADLYARCHAFVAPTRGEGFGLPMAEAMLYGLPVITTAGGGQADFCTEQTAWTVPFRFAPSGSHLNQGGALWMEPDEAALAARLREVHGATDAQRAARVQAATALAERELTWAQAARRMRGFVQELEAERPLARGPLKLGWVSSWNSKCGIAMYSDYLLRELPAASVDVRVFASRRDQPIRLDAPNVVRCWDDYNAHQLDDLEAALLASGLDVVVLQFNFGFFHLPSLGRLLSRLHARGVRTVVAFHSTRDVDKPDLKASLRDIRAALAQADRLLVHSVTDLNFLTSLGLERNATLFPHGMVYQPTGPVAAARARLGLPADAKVLATYGFLLPHKGTEQLIEALPALARRFPDVRLLLANALYPGGGSAELAERNARRVRELGLEERVLAVHDFLEDAESLRLLECADAVLFPYQETGESSSAAVRFGLSAQRPVVVTPLDIFSNVAPVVHTLPGTGPEAIARGMAELLADPARLASRAAAQEAWVRAHSWPVLSRRLLGMMRGLLNGDGRPVALDQAA